MSDERFGWLGPEAAREAWPSIADEFRPFRIYGATEVKRTCAWDAWSKIGWDINKSILFKQEIGDCVSFGAAIAVAAVMAYEAVIIQEPERFEVPFPPYLYAISRLMPEGGNGRLRGDGSLGSWMAATVKKYGVLRANFTGVPTYSGTVAKAWGSKKSPWQEFVPEADDHCIKTVAPINNCADLAQAITNGYFVTIASMRGYAMDLKDDKGKSWFVGRDSWPHQMSIIAVDTEPELCFYRRNQWANAHGPQLDGPDGGGWIRAEELESELRDGDTECFAFSQFDGFPSDEKKPRNWYA